MKIVDMEKWAPHVGIFMLEFGAVESFARSLLEELTPPTIYKHIKELPLGRKIKLIIELLESSNEHLDLRQELVKAFQHIDRLTRVRNIIAHNTVKLVFWSDAGPGVAPFDEVLHSDANDKTISLDELKSFNTQLSGLVETLYRIAAAMRGRKVAQHLEHFKISGLGTSEFSG
jgi:hypothetical protein